MLVELRVRDLGVIADLTLLLQPGMTALTGETGAGKTLVVEAIELLVGGRADAMLVRPGATEATVEGRFVNPGGDEVVLARTVPVSGRSRAYLDGRMVPVSALAEAAAGLVDLHGQHAHQSLLAAGVQRAALDAFAGTDLEPLRAARRRVKEIDDQLAALGGDARARARETDLLRFQVNELDGAGLTDPDEDERLAEEQDRLAGAASHRAAAAAAHEALSGEGAAGDAVGAAISALAGHAPLASFEARLRSIAAELTDAAAELRNEAESFEDDPERLTAIAERRQLLHDLRRKYGDSLAEVIAYAGQAAARLAELEGYEATASRLEAERAAATAAVTQAEAAVGAHRRKAAPALAKAIEKRLRELALPRARFTVVVSDADPGDEVTYLFGANAGEAVLPLAKVASGGELARAMLAARLVLDAVQPETPATLVFDEVDAGIGGEAAVAVGQALAALGRPASAGAGDERQVLVVTHLPQVAAFADHQIAVVKEERRGRTVANAACLDEAGRVVELSRMLSGQSGSTTARGHAEELLAVAARRRGREAL